MSKVQDAFMGLAIGDALGVPFELVSRKTLAENPVIDMVGFKAHNQPSGTWSDDASMTFCTAESLMNGFDVELMGRNFLRWFDEGYWSARGVAFGSGGTTRKALSKIREGQKAANAGSIEHKDSGNGSLMRILPLAFYAKDFSIYDRYSIVESASSITHRSPLARLCCFYYVEFAIGLLNGVPRSELYNSLQETITNFFLQNIVSEDSIQVEDVEMLSRLLEGNIHDLPEEHIMSDSYVLHTLESSIWCLMTTDSYEEAVLKAVNLGGDSDSTAAVTGGLAGILYGLNHVPSHWKTGLARHDDIVDLCNRFEESLLFTVL